ncbi:MAG: hypothetical protein R2727_06755 [Bacteroidales bacterium]
MVRTGSLKCNKFMIEGEMEINKKFYDRHKDMLKADVILVSPPYLLITTDSGAAG